MLCTTVMKTKNYFTARIVDNFIFNEFQILFQIKKSVPSKGKNHLLYLIFSTSFDISFRAIQRAQQNRMIKEIKMSFWFLPISVKRNNFVIYLRQV